MRRTRIWFTLAIFVGVGIASSALARQWNATPQVKAREYLIIQDQRSNNEIVVVFWIAPQAFVPGPDTKQTKRILEDYLLVGIVHANTNHLGEMSFRKLSNLNLKPFQGGVKSALDKQNLPPAVAAVVTASERIFTQNFGKMGTGTTWFVFDGKFNQSCGKGGFWVPYAGANYDYRTPVPGC